jgi:hypothetical protein
VSDVIARGWIGQVAVAAALFAVLAGVMGCDWWARQQEGIWPGADLQMLDAGAGNSLAAWLRAGTLALAAALAVIVYVVRRHRTDDYRGGYRIWLWASAWLLAMSADQVAGLRAAWEAACTQASGWGGATRGAVWWMAPCALAAAAIGGRLAIEMRECRTSTSFLLSSAGAWILGEGLRMSAGAAAPGSVIAVACGVLAQWGIAVALSVHARYVVLDAAGELRRRKKKSKVKAIVEAETTGKDETGEVGQSQETKSVASRPATPSKPVETARPVVRARERDDDEDEDERDSRNNRSGSQNGSGSSNKPASAPPRPTLTFGAPAARDERKMSKAERKQMRRAA